VDDLKIKNAPSYLTSWVDVIKAGEHWIFP